MKRAADILLAGAGIVLLSPLWLLAALLIRLDSPGPLLFRQLRVGRNGRCFFILKFRTMRGENGPLLTVADDARITRSGRWLRRTKLDELPQLLTVLAGDMSLVGPRPEVPDYADQWSEADRKIVLSVRPGITDFASVIFRHEDRLLAAQPHPEDYYRRVLTPQKLRLYRFYVRRSCLRLDLWLLLETLRAVLTRPMRLTWTRHQEPMETPGVKSEAPFWAAFLLAAMLSYLAPMAAVAAMTAVSLGAMALWPRRSLGIAAFVLGFKEIFNLDPGHSRYVMATTLTYLGLQTLLDRRSWRLCRNLHSHPLLALLILSLILNALHVALSPDAEGTVRLIWHLLGILTAFRAATLSDDTIAMASLKRSLIAGGAAIAILSALYLYIPMPALVGDVFIHTEVLRLVGIQDDANSIARWILPAAMAALIAANAKRPIPTLLWVMLWGMALLATASKSGLIWFAVALLALPFFTKRWKEMAASLLAVGLGAVLWFGVIEHPLKRHAATSWYESGLSNDGAVTVAYDLYTKTKPYYARLDKYAPKSIFGNFITSLRIRTTSEPIVIDANPETPPPRPRLILPPAGEPNKKAFVTNRDWSKIHDAPKKDVQSKLAKTEAVKAEQEELGILETGDRRRLWLAGIHIFGSHPWWGIGAMGWPAEMIKEVRFPYSSPHNGFLQVSGSYGLLGALLYLAAIARLGWLIIRRRGDIWVLSSLSCAFAFELFDVSSIFTPTLIGAVSSMLIGVLEGGLRLRRPSD